MGIQRLLRKLRQIFHIGAVSQRLRGRAYDRASVAIYVEGKSEASALECTQPYRPTIGQILNGPSFVTTW
jgi:hypothetical protein